MKSSWIGIGFSHHSVPSLSNTATRSSTGTAADLSTNSTIVCLVGPSCQLSSNSSRTADNPFGPDTATDNRSHTTSNPPTPGPVITPDV